jgi:hypothetical protein
VYTETESGIRGMLKEGRNKDGRMEGRKGCNKNVKTFETGRREYIVRGMRIERIMGVGEDEEDEGMDGWIDGWMRREGRNRGKRRGRATNIKKRT